MTKSRAPDQEKSGTDHFEKSPILLPSPPSANINFYELTRARSASLVPQTGTKRSYRSLNCFLPLALSVTLQIRHLGASESLNLLAVFVVCDTL